MAHILLQAALAPTDRAREAFEQWWAAPDEEKVGKRLLPYLFQRAAELDLHSDARKFLAAAYRHSALQAHARRRLWLDVLAAANWPQIPWLALKGAALSEFYYTDPALRPMGDVDFLIRPLDQSRFCQGLSALGFRCKDEHDHSQTFRHSNGLELDVHTRSLSECLWEGADQDFWELAEERLVEGRPWWVLCPAHQLLHVCAHGSKWDGRNSPWQLDALQILGRCRIDWDEFWRAARRRRLQAALAKALSELEPYAEIPRFEVQTSWSDRVYARLRSSSPGAGRHFALDVFTHARENTQAGLVSYLQHLSRRWGAKNWTHLPALFLGRALREASQGPKTSARLPGAPISPLQVDCLRATLGEPDALARALPQWADILRRIPVAKRISPLLAERCPTPDNLLKVSQIYARKRWEAYHVVVAEVLELLQEFNPGVPRGPWLAENYYASPWLRHCHGLDVFLDPAAEPESLARTLEKRASAASRLQDKGYVSSGPGRWKHSGGLEISLQQSLLPDAYYAFTPVWQEALVCGVRARVLDGPELLTFLVARASLQPVAFTWVLDFVQVFRQHRAQWACVAPLLSRARLSLVTLSIIEDLEKILGVKLDATATLVPSQDEWEAAWRAARRRGSSRRDLLSGIDNWELRLRFAVWLFKDLPGVTHDCFGAARRATGLGRK